MRFATLACAAVAFAVAVSTPATAQQSNRLTLADYLEWETVGSPSLSPDGSQILFSRRRVDKMNDRRISSLWIMDADGSRPRQLLDEASSAEWSPDGSRIAFVAPGEPSGSQIFVRYMDAEGATTQITNLTSSPGSITWSPDGEWIAFTMSAPREGGGWSVEVRLVDAIDHARSEQRRRAPDRNADVRREVVVTAVQRVLAHRKRAPIGLNRPDVRLIDRPEAADP